MDAKARNFRVVVNVFDVITNIELKEFRLQVSHRSTNGAITKARKQVEDIVLGWAKDAAKQRYALTAKQLRLLVEDGLINPYNSYAIEVADCYELNPSYNHPYVQEVLADSLW